MKTVFSFLIVIILACPSIVANGQGSHVLIVPSPLHFRDIANFAWNGGSDDVSYTVWCLSNSSTEPSQAAGSVVQSGSGRVLEDGVPEPFSLQMGPTSNWTAGGANCTVQADIFSYSGGSGNYQRKFAYVNFSVLP